MADLYIGVVDWNKDYKHVLQVTGNQFENVLTHMNTHDLKPIHINEFSLIKINDGSGEIKINEYYNRIQFYNYVMFRNSASGGYFYAFIDSMGFEAHKTLHIKFTIDIWQMYTGSLTFKNSFVERMHIPKNADTVGRWLAPEPFSPNFNVIQNSQDVTPVDDWVRFTWLDSVSYPDANNTTEPFSYGGILATNALIGGYTGFYKMETGYLTNTQFSKLLNIYANLEPGNDHRKDLIHITCVPKWLWNNTTDYMQVTIPGVDVPIGIKNCNDVVVNYNTTTFSNNLACGYVPQNNKLYTSLCNQYLIYNNNGLKKVYLPENFTNGFNENHTISLITNSYTSNTIMVMVHNYSDKSKQYFTLPYNCTLPITYDSNETLANKLSALGNILTSSLNSVSNASGNAQSFLSGNYYNTAGLGSSLSSMQYTAIDYLQKTSENFVTVGNASDFTTTRPENICIRFARVSPLADQCREIDNYLTVYGYQINEITLPSITTRSNWNYLQGDINFACNVNGNDKERLKQIFKNGVTVWHNPTNMINYALPNN